MDEIKQYDRTCSSLLDVGCCMGTFLYTAQKYYEKVYGLEVSLRMASFVERNIGIKVFLDRFENLNTNEKFSCINMSHVIEHIPNPHIWLKKAKGLLCEGGILVISVPNMFLFTRKLKLFLKYIRLRKDNWKPWQTPDHLYEPTMPSMRKII